MAVAGNSLCLLNDKKASTLLLVQMKVLIQVPMPMRALMQALVSVLVQMPEQLSLQCTKNNGLKPMCVFDLRDVNKYYGSLKNK